jgi:hypothetical protein
MNTAFEKIAEITYYRRNIAWCELVYWRELIKNGFKPRKTILFYPTKPLSWHILYSICHMLGYRMTNDPKAHFDVAVAFQDATVRPSDKILDEIAAHHKVININCADIGKDRVDRIFEEVFGYGVAVDPRTYKGAYVKKPVLNARHSVEAFGLLTEPSEPEPGYVYQKLIDNKSGAHSATDVRTFIFGSAIPFLLYRKKDISDRFNDDTIIATRADVSDFLTEKEHADVLRFCRAFGLDYGELDILRDNSDGKIYIVDVNNTPSGPQPGIHITRPAYARFRRELAQAFETLIKDYQ